MGKRKHNRFEDLKTFDNVFQPDFNQVLDRDFEHKGHWSTKHFKNNHPIILELGCGKGEYTIGLARRFPELNFIGIDIKGDRIWTGAKQASQDKIPNVTFIRTQIEFVNSFFSPGEVDEIWLTFPDPQLKMRRHKKRLTATRFLNLYRKFLKDKGIIHLKTDNSVLFAYTQEIARFNNLPIEFATDDLYGSDNSDLVYGIQTYYEKQFVEAGLNIHYLKFRLPNEKIILEPANGEE